MLTPVILDFETYWSSTHSLTKMSGIEYVMHEDTEVISCSIQVGFNGTPKTIFGFDNLQAEFNTIDWDTSWCIGHNNSEFDAMILAWRFGIRPKMWGCTLAMARPIHTKTTGCSLKALAEHYGLQAKGNLEATNTKGKYLKDFTPDELDAMRVYNDIDTVICAQLFPILAKQTSHRELRIIDQTMRMLTEPKFEVNTNLLARGAKAEFNRKQKVLKRIGAMLDPLFDPDCDTAIETVQKNLKSGKKFKEFLESLDVDVPYKESPSNGKMIPALAKTDQGFLKLKDHDNELVAEAVEAKLDTQSSILETRMKRFIDVANMCDGKLPIALRYYGADTTGRWSGTMKMNQQNLPRVSPNKPKISDVLRKSMRAPQGYKVVVADLSGIELRVNMFLWKVPYAMKLFTDDPANADLYKYFSAHTLYNIAESDVTKDQRQVGKVSHLGLGFGAGGVTFKDVAKLMGGVDLTQDESQEIVNAYRRAHPEVKQGWRTCHSALDFVSSGSNFQIDDWGLCHTTKEGIATPFGVIRYPYLRQEVDSETGNTEWKYGKGSRTARIYAGKVTENIVQHLARNIIADIALDVSKTRLGKMYPLAHSVHDELIYVVKDEDAQDMLDTIQQKMRQPIPWWPELKTWSEGDIAQTYGDAK